MPETPKSVLTFPKQGRAPLAEERFAVCLSLGLFREWRLQNRAPFKFDGRRFNSLESLAQYLAQQHVPPAGISTVWNWLRRFDAAIRENRDPLSALCDRRRSDANRSRFFDRHPAAETYVRERMRVKGTSARKVHRELCSKWVEFGFAHDAPSYGTVLEYLKLLKRNRRAARRGRGAA